MVRGNRHGRIAVAAAVAVAGLAMVSTLTADDGWDLHGPPVPILMYHVIAKPSPGEALPELFVSPRDFAGQMRWLARHGYYAVSLRQVYDYWFRGAALPGRAIVISFDDGYLSHHTRALPVLRSLHWAGVLNLKVNALRSVHVLPAWRVRDLIDAGWEIDAHTIGHPDLTTLDDVALWREVHGSREALRRMFHVPVDFFCYPDGRYDARVMGAVRRAGYLGATTTHYGPARPSDLYLLSRVRIDGTDGIAGFARKLEGLPASPY